MKRKWNIIPDKETKLEKSKIDFLSDFSQASIDKSAEVEINPKFEIEGVGIEYAKNVLILSEPYKVEIPKEKSIKANNKIWMIDLDYQEVKHTFIAEAGSFRFQLGVIMKKLDYTEPKELIGLPVRIWKVIANIKTPTFTGKAEVYKVALM